MNVGTLASKRNLRLAWRRITTGANSQYKRFYRHLYHAYELALEENLEDLRARMVSRAWEPRSPDRVYLPKPSGLQRPLTLLHLEDQIVLQAIANIVANKVAKRRRPFAMRSVFSNILTSPRSIFFFARWDRTYRAFSKHVERLFQNGMIWVADFDLAAFYETISHDLLLRTAYPRLRDTDDVRWVKRCLSCWTSQRAANEMGHGLPQGPIASDFLAEVFLLPVDERMRLHKGYARYVDDVRLFATAESKIRQAVVQLEIACRERGLIPQVGKFAIRKASSASDARAMLPSVGAARDSNRPRLAPAAAEKLLRTAVAGHPLRVVDKTRVRYVFVRAKPSPRLLKLACTLLTRHPEHVDALTTFLSQYDYRKSIRDCCLEVLTRTPYEHIRGEMWHILARYYREPRAFDSKARRRYVKRAIEVLKDRQAGTTLKWGIAHFLCTAEKYDGRRYTRFLRHQPSALLQGLIAPALPRTALAKDGVVQDFLARSAIEPGIGLAGPLTAAGIRPSSHGIKASALPRQVRHIFAALGLVRTKNSPLDIVGDILGRRYGIVGAGSWRRLLGSEYAHAAGLLVQADAAFFSGPSYWLSHQNSFNQVVFLALQRHLSATGGAGVVTTYSASGDLVHYGTTLDKGNAFSKVHPTIAVAFRGMNDRRNQLPGSHPYDKKSAAQTKYLKSQERNKFVAQLKVAYAAVAALSPKS